ncbi:MAG: hypothetical protein HQL42_03020 [Alphaproteobacteria bacterium]|nr:hypothetical protein [Alphaproteobacteria bacterium]
MDRLEAILAMHPATISAISSLGTIGAVIVALYLARSQSRSRLRVFADVSRYVSSEAQAGAEEIDLTICPRTISATIQNIGHNSVRICYFSSFIWSAPLTRRVAWQNPKEPDFRSEPIELRPGTAVSIVISDDIAGHVEMVNELCRHSPLRGFARHFLGLTIITETGDRFRAKIGRSLRSLEIRA